MARKTIPTFDLRTIDRGGLFSGVSHRRYFEDPLPTPSVNASTLFDLHEASPRHAWTNHPRLNPGYASSTSSSNEMDFGSAAHTALMGVGKVDIVEKNNWQSDHAKTARQRARANGATPILQRDWQRVREMVTTLRQDLQSIESPLADVFDPKWKGTAEVLAAWREVSTADPNSHVWCRARADWFIGSKIAAPFAPNGIIIDYKTTGISAEALSWAAGMYRLGSHFQAVWYPHGFAKAISEQTDVPQAKLPRFVFIVQETFPPYAHTVHEMSDIALETARSELIDSFARWCACLKTGEWPAYPRIINHVHPPAWRVRDNEMRRVAADVMQRGI